MINWIKRLFKKEKKAGSKPQHIKESGNTASTISGEQNNIATQTVPAGYKNTASGIYSVIGGITKETSKPKPELGRQTPSQSRRSSESDDSSDLLNPMNPISPVNPISPIWHFYSSPVHHDSSHDSESSWDSSSHDSGSSYDSGSSWDSSSDSSSFDSTSSFD